MALYRAAKVCPYANPPAALPGAESFLERKPWPVRVGVEQESFSSRWMFQSR